MFPALFLILAAAGGEPETPKSSPEPAQAAAPAAPNLNLMGRTNTASGESRRNENIQVNMIDNNGAKELAKRMGTSATTFTEFSPSRRNYGGEYGAADMRPIHLPVSQAVRGVHGQVYWSHINSVFAARSFFQAGGVQPARENQYGVSAGVGLWNNAWLTVDASQTKTRGQVNGNILVPKADERTPRGTDPAERALIARWIAAYPAAEPNRTDIDPRALNTNAPQAIDTDSTMLRLDQILGSQDRLILRHSYTNQAIDAFQLVAGQNPDTTTKHHAARATWLRVVSADTNFELSTGFERTHALLVPEPNAVGPQVQVGTAFTTLGPGSSIPIDRVQNRYRYAGLMRQRRGQHTLTLGGEVDRTQFNGREAGSDRGNYFFRNDFGRDAITNFLLGVPNRYSAGLGLLDRGFRNWEQHYFAGDTWQARPGMTLNFGLRYQPQNGPTEVNDLTIIPYRCDCNNVAPSFGIAQRLPGRWGVFRGAYSVQFGEIFPTTFQQLRWNPPNFLKTEVRAPELLNPLAGADFSPDARSIFAAVPEDLKTPYSHLYSGTWEMELSRSWRLQLGYVGSRTHKLLLIWYTNRAQIVPGIPLTTATINDRRPDSRYFEFRPAQNGARAYFDAGRVTLLAPSWNGLSLDTSYWISKAIDTGATYLNTAAGDDARQGYSQSEFLVQEDLKGPSAFDQSHAFLMRARYETPALSAAPKWLRIAGGRWSFSGITLAKTGTPFTVISSSDAPGFGNVDGTSGDRPNLLDPSILGRRFSNPDTSEALLPRTAFAFIRPGESRGNLGNAVFRRAGIFNINAAVGKTWLIASERSVTFRAESINATNTPQFAEPLFDLTSPAFGKITNTLNDGRAFRFTLRLAF